MKGYRQRQHPRLSRATLIILLYGSLSAIAFLIGWLRGDLDLYRTEGSTTTWLMVSPVVGIALGLAFVSLSRLSVRRWRWARRLHADFRSILGQLSTAEILILAVASAVGEELLFRGALLPWLGIWAQAFIFALLHVGPSRRFLPWTASALVVGLFFGWLYQATGDLGAPIVCHFTINCLNLHFISRVELPKEAAEFGSDPPEATLLARGAAESSLDPKR